MLVRAAEPTDRTGTDLEAGEGGAPRGDLHRARLGLDGEGVSVLPAGERDRQRLVAEVVDGDRRLGAPAALHGQRDQLTAEFGERPDRDLPLDHIADLGVLGRFDADAEGSRPGHGVRCPRGRKGDLRGALGPGIQPQHIRLHPSPSRGVAGRPQPVLLDGVARVADA